MNKFNSTFGQILQIFPRSEFYSLVLETGSERRAKGFIVKPPKLGPPLKLDFFHLIL